MSSHAGGQLTPAPSGVGLQVRQGCATLTLNRPDRRNALGPADWEALARAVGSVARDQGVRAVVVRGVGGAFSAGGDLKTMSERLALPLEVRRRNLLEHAEVVRALLELDRPVVAAIDGPALGAGLALALACDVRIASDRSRFGAPYHRVGLTTDFGLSWLLARAIGPTRAADLLFGGETISAERAEQIGLVSRVVAPEAFDGEVAAYVARLTDGPPLALAYTKRALRLATERAFAEMAAWEADAQARCSRSADAVEGVQAFAEKRAPRFRGA